MGVATTTASAPAIASDLARRRGYPVHRARAPRPPRVASTSITATSAKRSARDASTRAWRLPMTPAPTSATRSGRSASAGGGKSGAVDMRRTADFLTRYRRGAGEKRCSARQPGENRRGRRRAPSTRPSEMPPARGVPSPRSIRRTSSAAASSLSADGLRASRVRASRRPSDRSSPASPSDADARRSRAR